jgi:hypothetical protein
MEPKDPNHNFAGDEGWQPGLTPWARLDKGQLFRTAAILATLALILWAVSYFHPKSSHRMNAQFMHYQEQENIIHIGQGDSGNPEVGPAVVETGQWIIIGHEWVFGELSLAEAEQQIMQNPAADLLLSVDGGPWQSVKDYFQAPFIPEFGTRPFWNWDHDGDSYGDGDQDGVGDWPGVPLVFIRIPFKFNQAGEHTFEFRYSAAMGGYSATILVKVVERN